MEGRWFRIQGWLSLALGTSGQWKRSQYNPELKRRDLKASLWVQPLGHHSLAVTLGSCLTSLSLCVLVGKTETTAAISQGY